MFVKSLELIDFRGIRKVDKQLTFKRLNVLIGRNNSGKTQFGCTILAASL